MYVYLLSSLMCLVQSCSVHGLENHQAKIDIWLRYQSSQSTDDGFAVGNTWTTCTDWPPTDEEIMRSVFRPHLSSRFSSHLRQLILNLDFLAEIPSKKQSVDKVRSATNSITAQCTTLQVPLNWDSLDYFLDKPISTESLSALLSNITTIDYYLTRFLATTSCSSSVGTSNNLWVLNGGPGESGEELYSYMAPFWSQLNGTYNIYLPDHRGTGYSSPIYCETSDIDYIDNRLNASRQYYQNCVDYLSNHYQNDITYYSTYGAAMDLGYALSLFTNQTASVDSSQRSDNTSSKTDNNISSIPPKTVIYGLSYGSYWLNQVMQLFGSNINILPPENTASVSSKAMKFSSNKTKKGLDIGPSITSTKIDGYILDGILPSSTGRYVSYDLDSDNVGRDFMTECEQNAFCASKFAGESPYIVLANVVTQIRDLNQSCVNLNNIPLDKESVSVALWELLADFDMRVLIPPIVYRLNRCNDDDVAALNVFASIAESVVNSTSFSNTSNLTNILGNNILLSELFFEADPQHTVPPSQGLLLRQDESLIFATYGPQRLQPFWNIWNRYEPNKEVYNKYAVDLKYNASLLLLNGDLDSQTAYYEAAYAASVYNCSFDDVRAGYDEYGRKYFITVPRSTHVTCVGSPMVGSNYTCGSLIIKSFLESREMIPDDSCVELVEQIDWEGSTEISMAYSYVYLGTTDMWG